GRCRDRLPRDVLAHRPARAAVQRSRHRVGLLRPAAGGLRGVARGQAVTTAVAEPVDDDLWSAIGEPTRTRMLALLLVEGHGTATSLSEQLPVTRQAVSKHLTVLDR